MVQIPIRYPAADLRSIHQMGKYTSNGNCIHRSSKLADEEREPKMLYFVQGSRSLAANFFLLLKSSVICSRK